MTIKSALPCAQAVVVTLSLTLIPTSKAENMTTQPHPANSYKKTYGDDWNCTAPLRETNSGTCEDRREQS